ncbi:COX17 protein [Pleomassaria siparia CBS 279.74]|uniref:COX17 protein n=1 Tax=Pleomassaria siparia CBS 279.74 TaxID=1314801 RepID=A0A6G1JX94_9PLEO|nr:COX17 protein [Pleomassaria siparia CBS 279.74]
MGSGQSTPAASIPAKIATPAGDAKKPKPCCVCLDEKAKRDECMLFSTSDNAQTECADLVTKYKDCMAGYGFKI